MKAFTIDIENNITVYASPKTAPKTDGSEAFGSEKELTGLAANWPAARLVEIFNSLPGNAPVRKFTDRKTAVSRIWKALQSFAENAPVVESVEETTPAPEATPAAEQTTEAVQPVAAVPETPFDAPVAPQSADVTPKEAPAKKKANRAKKAPKPARKATTPAGSGPRATSKTAQLIEMLKRADGATLDEICAKFGWQRHTTRAMMSAGGSLAKKHGLVVISEKVGDERRYSIKG
jgi:hypothetical protein